MEVCFPSQRFYWKNRVYFVNLRDFHGRITTAGGTAVDLDYMPSKRREKRRQREIHQFSSPPDIFFLKNLVAVVGMNHVIERLRSRTYTYQCSLSLSFEHYTVVSSTNKMIKNGRNGRRNQPINPPLFCCCLEGERYGGWQTRMASSHPDRQGLHT